MTTLKIGYRDFALLPLTEEQEAELDVWGLFNPEHGSISVFPRLTPDHQAAILLHELIHAGLHVTAHRQKRLDEESIATALERGLGAIFRDNPVVLEMLAKGFGGEPIMALQAAE